MDIVYDELSFLHSLLLLLFVVVVLAASSLLDDEEDASCLLPCLRLLFLLSSLLLPLLSFLWIVMLVLWTPAEVMLLVHTNPFLFRLVLLSELPYLPQIPVALAAKNFLVPLSR